MNWYALHIKPHQENLAQHSLQKLGVESFCPLLKQTKLIRRRRQTVIGPLFPGYLFARINPEIHCRAVNYARGVRRLVAFGEIPVVVDDQIIESIKSKIKHESAAIPLCLFTPGQIVRIQEGPLRGFEAVFEREMSDQQRVALLLQMLSYQARVVVELNHIEAVPS